MNHERDSIVVVDVVTGLGKTLQRTFCLFELVCADEEPRRLRCEVGRNGKGKWPQPLYGERNTVRPCVRSVHQALQHTGRDHLSDNPAEVDVCSEVTSNGQRSDLGSIRRTSGGKDTPRNVAKSLTSEQDTDIGGEEDDEDEGAKPEETANEDLAVTPSGSGPSVEQSTNNVTNSGEAVESLLPSRRDLVAVFFVEELAILLTESWVTVKRREQSHVVTLHDDRHGDDCSC